MYTKLDDQFNKIQSLAWLPWVGSEYFNIPKENRILIIGESHYGDKGREESIEFFKNRAKTRELHEEIAIEGKSYGTRIFPNLYSTLFPQSDMSLEKREKFWQLTSYYNFVQRPMLKDLEGQGNTEKPKPHDFRSGWHTFFELNKLLKPQLCLFIGTTSADSFNSEILRAGDLKADKIEWHSEAINGAYPKFTKLYLSDIETSLYFIKHTSSRFSPQKWNEYLNLKIGNHLQWLENELG